MKRILGLATILAIAAAANADPFQNGSFEIGPDPGVFTTLNNGSTAIDGWVVGGSSVDYIGSYWQAADGNRSIDLGGNNTGAISQTFDTVVGQTYLLNFSMAGNLDNGDSLFVLNASVGDLNLDYSFVPPPGSSHANMNWESKFGLFTATSSSSTLTFTSIVPPGAFGPTLDAVSIQAVPEPATLAVLGLGAIGLLRRRRSGKRA